MGPDQDYTSLTITKSSMIKHNWRYGAQAPLLTLASGAQLLTSFTGNAKPSWRPDKLVLLAQAAKIAVNLAVVIAS